MVGIKTRDSFFEGMTFLEEAATVPPGAERNALIGRFLVCADRFWGMLERRQVRDSIRDDVAAEARLALFSKLSKRPLLNLSSGGNALDYFGRIYSRILSRQSMRMIRHGHREKLFSFSFTGDEATERELVCDATTPSERAENDDLTQLLHQSITRLDDQSRLIMELSFFAGKSDSEIAGTVDMSRASVQRQRRNALKKLHELMNGS